MRIIMGKDKGSILNSFWFLWVFYEIGLCLAKRVKWYQPWNDIKPSYKWNVDLHFIIEPAESFTMLELKLIQVPVILNIDYIDVR